MSPRFFIAALRDPDSTGAPSLGFFAAIRLNLSHKNPVDKKRISCAKGDCVSAEGVPDDQANSLDRYRRSSFAVWHGPSYGDATYGDANRASKRM
jgi:hypothetical protein